MPNFTKRQVSILKNWLHRHIDNPYPSHKDKEALCRESGLSRKQIQNWFTNARKVSKLSNQTDARTPKLYNRVLIIMGMKNRRWHFEDVIEMCKIKLNLARVLSPADCSFKSGYFEEAKIDVPFRETSSYPL